MERKNKGLSDNSGETALNMTFIIALLAVIVLLMALVIGMFFIVLNDFAAKDGDGSAKKPSAVTTVSPDGPSTPVISDKNALFPTKESRSSYKIGTSSAVVTLSGDDFIKSNNTILVKLESDSMTSIVEKNADAKMYPASMTKVMTLVVACEQVTDLSKKLTVTEEIAKYASDQGGSGVGLKVGESYSIEDLLYLVIYKSDTIACLLLANDIAGSEAAFVAMMNQKVAYLGLTGTNFANCTGLYDPNNYSTCRDIASIMAYALDNEMALKCLTSFTGRPMTVGGVPCTFYSAWYSERFDDNPKLSTVTVKGGKTGYIDESGMSLVSYAVGKNGEKYINVIVGQPKGSGLSEDISTSEVKKIYNTHAK